MSTTVCSSKFVLMSRVIRHHGRWEEKLFPAFPPADFCTATSKSFLQSKQQTHWYCSSRYNINLWRSFQSCKQVSVVLLVFSLSAKTKCYPQPSKTLSICHSQPFSQVRKCGSSLAGIIKSTSRQVGHLDWMWSLALKCFFVFFKSAMYSCCHCIL